MAGINRVIMVVMAIMGIKEMETKGIVMVTVKGVVMVTATAVDSPTPLMEIAPRRKAVQQTQQEARDPKLAPKEAGLSLSRRRTSLSPGEIHPHLPPVR